MKRFVFLICLAGLATPMHAQGISRSHGLGFRLSFWNMADQTFRLNLDTAPARGSVDLAGVGFWLSYHSRIQRNWFMQFDLASVATIHSEFSTENEGDADVSAVVPILLGVRHYPMADRLRGALQPYWGAGAGPYWVSQFDVQERAQSTNVTLSGTSQVIYGGYASAGAHLLFTSWLALTFDSKYHFVDWRSKGTYSGPEFGLGLTVMWGKSREMYQIMGTRLIVENLYPAYYQFYNTYPLALVTIRNLTGYPIEVNVRSHIDGYTARDKDSGFIRLERHETRDIPVTVIFGPQLLKVAGRAPAVLDLMVEGRAGNTLRKTLSAELVIHHRNAWDGDMQKLKFFVTADDAQIMQQMQAWISRDSIGTNALDIARTLFDRLSAYGLRYRHDPNIPFYKDERVLSPVETLQSGGGDCDDLTVLCASFLESAGIHTAFVEVKDPDKSMAHLYLLFSTALAPDQAETISSNEKRYIIRENERGESLLWIPLECTLLQTGFENAWLSGATQYLNEAVVRNGLAEGWVTIHDVE